MSANSSKSDPRSVTLRAFGVLDALAQSSGPVGLLELARLTRLPKPSAHRIAQMLEQADLVARSPGGSYEPGAALRRLAFRVVGRGASADGTQAVLREVADETGESAAIAVLEGGELLVMAHVASGWPLRLALGAGDRLPIHCTAAGKILLANLPPVRRARLLAGVHSRRYTPHTLTDCAALDGELDRARDAGWAIEAEEYLAGSGAIAVPVRAAGAPAVVAALTLLAPTARVAPAALETHRPRLASAAERLGRILSE